MTTRIEPCGCYMVARWAFCFWRDSGYAARILSPSETGAGWAVSVSLPSRVC